MVVWFQGDYEQETIVLLSLPAFFVLSIVNVGAGGLPLSDERQLDRTEE